MRVSRGLAWAMLFLVPWFTHASQPPTVFPIEDAERPDAVSSYDEKPATLSATTVQKTEGEKSLYFKTGAQPNLGSRITRFRWPEPKDLSATAEDGRVQFDLWIADPSIMCNDSVGARFGFLIGSRSNGHFAVWRIPSELTKPKAWSRVALRVQNGKPLLKPSTVNGVSLATYKHGAAYLQKGVPDWSQIKFDATARCSSARSKPTAARSTAKAAVTGGMPA